MENDELGKNRAKKAAFIIGIVTFLGFSLIMFLPSVYSGGMASLAIGFWFCLVPAGILVAYLARKIVYFFFKNFIKSKLTYRITLAVSIVLFYFLGILALLLVGRGVALIFNRPYTNEIDTNRDGKIDKWVHDDTYSTVTTLDTNYDGIPDIKKYYNNNGDLIKTEKLSLSETNKK